MNTRKKQTFGDAHAHTQSTLYRCVYPASGVAGAIGAQTTRGTARNMTNDLDDGAAERTGGSEGPADDGVTAGLPEGLAVELRVTFAMFGDGRGRLPVGRLLQAFQAMGANATDGDVIAAALRHDPDFRGHVDRARWTAIMVDRWAEEAARRREFRDRLAAGDPARSGRVAADHARSVVAAFGPELGAVDVDRILAAGETAHLGFVDYDQLIDATIRPARLDRVLP